MGCEFPRRSSGPSFLPFRSAPYSVRDANRYHGRILFTNARIEVSAFAIVVWRTYPNIKMLKFFLLVRTLVTQATVYFIAVAVVHIFVLVVSAHLGDV